MKYRLAASWAITSVVLTLSLALASAADSSGGPEKTKPIEPVTKPTIAKPSDALVPKTKELGKSDAATVVKEHASAPIQVPPSATHTPSGRTINDLKVTAASPNPSRPIAVEAPPKTQGTLSASPPTAKNAASAVSSSTPGATSERVSAPAPTSTPVGPGSSASQPFNADPLEERVRSLLQDRLGKDGEVILRVSPDTPIGKAESTAGRAAPRGQAGVGTPVAARAEGSKAEDFVLQVKGSSGSASVGSDLQAWDWRGARGPEYWGRLDPSYGACSSGKTQSPPRIAESQVITSPGLGLPQINWKQLGFRWTRHGALWTANLDAGSSSIFRGQSYALEGIQFRIPGEPYIGDKAPAASIHFIHKLESRFFIISVTIEIDDNAVSKPAITNLLRRFPFDASDLLNWNGLVFDPQSLLPLQLRSGVLFSGSLSYPPCTESVLWLLAQPSILLPTAQWVELSRLLGVGARPLQPLNGRPVLHIQSIKP